MAEKLNNIIFWSIHLFFSHQIQCKGRILRKSQGSSDFFQKEYPILVIFLIPLPNYGETKLVIYK